MIFFLFFVFNMSAMNETHSIIKQPEEKSDVFTMQRLKKEWLLFENQVKDCCSFMNVSGMNEETSKWKLCVELQKAGTNWYKAYERQEEAWLLLKKTSAGQLWQIASLVDDKYKLSETKILYLLAFYNVKKTRESRQLHIMKMVEINCFKKFREISNKIEELEYDNEDFYDFWDSCEDLIEYNAL